MLGVLAPRSWIKWRICDLATQAADLCGGAQRPTWLRRSRRNLDSRLLDNTDGADPGPRGAQELALLAVKADVTEEIDRLLHACGVPPAILLAEATAIGRKLDFLMQEFNREANTLVLKGAEHRTHARLASSLKALIDQMREQVQNVE